MPAAHPPNPPPSGPPGPTIASFDDLRAVLHRMGAIPSPVGDAGHGPATVPPTPDPSPTPRDVITPDEAQEEMDDAEAAREAADTRAEREPGANRTWAELDASTEADRRFDLDFIATANKVFADQIRRAEGEEGTGDEWKVKGVDTLPASVRREFVRFLGELAKTAGKLAAKYGGDVS
jgi:hypothetical protein